MAGSQPALGLLTAHNLGLDAMRADWGYLDRLGIPSLWLFDQFAVPSVPEAGLWETWTLLAALCAETSRCTVGTLITNVAMRNPAVLAKQASTVDNLTGGRLVIGLGAGYHEIDHTWVGVPFLTARERVTRLHEAAEILDRLLRGERLTYQGTHFSVGDAQLAPLPARRPRPPLMLAAFGPSSLASVVALADGWSFTGRPGESPESAAARFAALGRQLDELCVVHGRDPQEIIRSYVAGFADEQAFSSVDAFDDVTGRLADAGARELVYYYMSPAQEAFRSAGPHWVDRPMLERLVGDGRWGVLDGASAGDVDASETADRLR